MNSRCFLFDGFSISLLRDENAGREDKSSSKESIASLSPCELDCERTPSDVRQVVCASSISDRINARRKPMIATIFPPRVSAAQSSILLRRQEYHSPGLLRSCPLVRRARRKQANAASAKLSERYGMEKRRKKTSRYRRACACRCGRAHNPRLLGRGRWPFQND